MENLSNLMKNDEEVEKDEVKGFMFLNSYLESYEILKNAAGEEVANKLLIAIAYYGIKGELVEDDYRITSVMASIIKTIDKARKNYLRRLERARKKEEQEKMVSNGCAGSGYSSYGRSIYGR